MTDSKSARNAIKQLADAMELELPADFNVDVELDDGDAAKAAGGGRTQARLLKGMSLRSAREINRGPVAAFRFNQLADIGAGVNMFRFTH